MRFSSKSIDYSYFLFQARELEIGVYYRDYRSLCATTFLKLVEFLDNQRHELILSLEPTGTLRCEVSYRYSIYQTHSNNLSAKADNSLSVFDHLVGLALKEFISCF